jgi:tetratricopeptide (TPR) repeat protein
MVLIYKRTEQWNLAREIFQKVLENYSEREKNGEIEMFVKVLNYQDENWGINDFLSKNRSFLGGKTLATWLNNHHKDYVIYAYKELGLYDLKHNCPDYAYLCYQEILEGEIELDSSSNMECFRGIGDVYAMKQEYSMAIDWFKKVIDIDINAKNISNIDSITIQLYKEILSIYNEKLNDPLSMIAYMKEIIDILVRRIDRLDQGNVLIVTIYKITVYFYHSTGNESKIILICNHIEEILNKFKIDDKSWRRWLCILSKCDLNRFKEIYHDGCRPIIDQNYNVYLKFYDNMYHLLCNNTTRQFEAEIKRCDHLRNTLKIIKLNRICEIFKLWETTNAPMNNHLNLTRSLSYSSFFMPMIEPVWELKLIFEKLKVEKIAEKLKWL